MEDAASNLRRTGATLGLVLGSGLGPFADALEPELAVPYGDIAGLPVSQVPGHAGRFLAARIAGRPVIIAQGRVHLYEGWNPAEVTAGVRFLHGLGVRTLLLTNAAGTVNPALPPGDWMMLTDHLNLTGQSPLFGGPNFFDMTEVYARRLRARFAAKASKFRDAGRIEGGGGQAVDRLQAKADDASLGQTGDRAMDHVAPVVGLRQIDPFRLRGRLGHRFLWLSE